MSDSDKRIVRRDRRVACENRVLRVYLDRVETADGREIEDFMVVEPTAQTVDGGLVSGAAVLPLLEGEFGLLDVYRHPMERAGLEVPRGFVDTGEDPAAAAIRELAEETGLVCTPENLQPLGYLCQEPGVIRARTALFAALDCRPGPKTAEHEAGHGGLHFFTEAEMRKMAAESVLEDGCTLTTWYRYQAWRAEA